MVKKMNKKEQIKKLEKKIEQIYMDAYQWSDNKEEYNRAILKANRLENKIRDLKKDTSQKIRKNTPNMFYCRRHKTYHRYSSKIGQTCLQKKHSKWVEKLENILDYHDPKAENLREKIEESEKHLDFYK